MRYRPQLTRLLIFVGVLGSATAVAAAIMHDPDTASAASAPDVVPQPTAAPAPSAPTVQPVQDCTPGSTGTYISQYGNVDVLCALSSDGRVWPSPRTAEQLSCRPTLCGNVAQGKASTFRSSCRNSTSS